MGLDVNASRPARVRKVIDGDDFSCHTGVVKIPPKHIPPARNILLHSPLRPPSKDARKTLNLTDKNVARE